MIIKDINRTIAFAFLLISANVFSQSIGFHVGATSATMYDRNEFRMDDENYESVLGIDVGIDVKFRLSDDSHILTGLSFYQNGFQEDASRNGNTGRIEKNVRLNYLKLPVSFLIQTKETGKLRFGVRGGTYFGYLLGGEFEAIDWFEEVELDAAYQSFDWGLTFGAVFNVNNFFFDIGYDLGLQNIDAGGTVLTSDTVRNRSLNVKLTYFLK